MWVSMQKAHSGKMSIHSWQGEYLSTPGEYPQRLQCAGSVPGPGLGPWHGSQAAVPVFWHCWIPWLLQLTCRWFGRAWPALLFHFTSHPWRCILTLQLLHRARILPGHPRTEPETFGWLWKLQGICDLSWWGCLQSPSSQTQNKWVWTRFHVMQHLTINTETHTQQKVCAHES